MEIESKKTSYFPNFWQAIFLIFLILLIELPFDMGRFVIAHFHPEWKSVWITCTLSLEKLLIIFIGLRLMRKRNKDQYKLRFKRVAISSLIVMVFMGIALMIIKKAIQEILPEMPERLAQLFRNLHPPTFYNFISSVIVGPILEEIFFRGILLEGFLKNYKPAIAIILSALFFGAIHMNRWQAASATLSGLLIGWAYWKTGSLIPGLVLHILNNLLVDQHLMRYVLGKIPFIWLLIIAVIILGVGLKFLNSRLDVAEEKVELETERNDLMN